MTIVAEAEIKLKNWLLSKKLVKANDIVSINRLSWNSGWVVSKNNKIIGSGYLNPRSRSIENFRFDIKPKNNRNNIVTKNRLNHNKSDILTIGDLFKF